jgi:5-(carboxyamino)imidazole ribonucleotide mutase
MPAGVPVATVSIGNSKNAGLLALRILALSDPELATKLEDFRQGQIEAVAEMNREISG